MRVARGHWRFLMRIQNPSDGILVRPPHAPGMIDIGVGLHYNPNRIHSASRVGHQFNGIDNGLIEKTKNVKKTPPTAAGENPLEPSRKGPKGPPRLAQNVEFDQ